MLLEATVTPLTSLPTAHPAPEAIRLHPADVLRHAVGPATPRFTVARAAARSRRTLGT